MSAREELDLLADYIMASIPGEPSQNQGAGETAVRLLKRYRAALSRIMDELGVPGEGALAPVSNAWVIARDALGL